MSRPPERILLLRSGRHLQVALDALRADSPGCDIEVMSMPPGAFFQPWPFITSGACARAWRSRFDRVCVLWNDPDGVGQSNVDRTALTVSPRGFRAITADGSLISRRSSDLLVREAWSAMWSIAVGTALRIFLFLPARVLRAVR